MFDLLGSSTWERIKAMPLSAGNLELIFEAMGEMFMEGQARGELG